MELCSVPVIYLGPNYGGGSEDNGDLLPCLCWKFLDTHRQVWVIFLWGHCPFPMGPCAQGSVCAVQESISQSYVSSGSSMVGLMVTSSKMAYAIPKPAAPSHTQAVGLRSPAPQQSTADPCLYRRCQNTASLVAQRVKHLPAMQETWVQHLGLEDPLQKEMAIHFGILAWKNPKD